MSARSIHSVSKIYYSHYSQDILLALFVKIDWLNVRQKLHNGWFADEQCRNCKEVKIKLTTLLRLHSGSYDDDADIYIYIYIYNKWPVPLLVNYYYSKWLSRGISLVYRDIDRDSVSRYTIDILQILVVWLDVTVHSWQQHREIDRDSVSKHICFLPSPLILTGYVSRRHGTHLTATHRVPWLRPWLGVTVQKWHPPWY